MPLIAPDNLHRFIAATFEAGGSETKEASLIADHLVAANLAGHDSHGIGMLPDYVENLKNGFLFANRHARIVTDSGAVLGIDGQRGFGQVIAKEAMDLGIKRARELGACVVALRNSHHIGRIGHWSEQCAAAGMASVHFVNVTDHGPLVSTFGGAEPRLGTNPFSACMPGDDGPFALLDMATSKVAFGKVRVAHNKRTPVVEGALLDGHGRATTNPDVMFEEPRGALRPFGEHKGSGLAIMCELFAGVLTGGATIHPDHGHDGGIINAMFSVIVQPTVLVPPERLREESAKLEAYVKGSRPSEGHVGPLMPGEPERRNATERRENGIPVDPNTWAGAIAAAKRLGLDGDRLDALVNHI